MPISVKKIAGKVASVTFQAGDTPDETVTLQYYPGRVTERAFAILQGNSTETDLMAGFKEFNEVLANLIQDWDVYEDDEQTMKFPVDPARFVELPLDLRMRAVGAIMGDMRPEAQTPQVSTPS